ncbi:hypothetical protein RHGRI_009740 [Rhododendron griersonianum]|uniref:O-fucosyltransferase family protein n=1 Tax=Rhododendron griersonianum TaxID=479676 RepID=A0AAV6KGI2_9ERIC|nr:hypothetical protein RHGRI_009740 [Rhododendron griersonianum]
MSTRPNIRRTAIAFVAGLGFTMFSVFKMSSRIPLLQTGRLRPENLGQNAIAIIRNLFFTFFVFGVLIFTFIAATYQPEDPLFHPSTEITTFLSSTLNATFRSDDTIFKTGEDFMAANQTAFADFINVTDVDEGDEGVTAAIPNHVCEVDKSINCKDQELFHVMMKAAIEQFKDIHFYRFGKPVRGLDDSSCHMAWRFRPKEGKRAAFYKDYRNFTIARSDNCSLDVAQIGEYRSGVNAKRRKKNHKPGFEKKHKKKGKHPVSLPTLGETVNDSLPVVESEASFAQGRYLVYNGGQDRCKSMSHYLWSFMCALGEAQYLNRTLVMDLTICLASIYTSSRQDEEGKDFRFYFDFEHLKESASVLDSSQFAFDWNRWHRKNGLKTHLVEDYRTTPMMLSGVEDTLVTRKFGSGEHSYWYRVCEGKTESVVQRPWHLVWKSKRLMDIVSAVASRLNWDFDSVHIERGEKAANKELWPNLDADTSPEPLLSKLTGKIDDGRNLYIATNEPDTSFFDPLKEKYSTHFLDEYKDLWDEKSEWYTETTKLNNGVPVEFDGYMKISVDTEVFLRGKTQIETFNDLTNDCKDGINTCTSSAI